MDVPLTRRLATRSPTPFFVGDRIPLTRHPCLQPIWQTATVVKNVHVGTTAAVVTTAAASRPAARHASAPRANASVGTRASAARHAAARSPPAAAQLRPSEFSQSTVHMMAS
jgi:hypothetical protein